MNTELFNYIEGNLHALTVEFTNTIKEARYIEDDWNSGNLLEHPVMEEFIEYCGESLNESMHGEDAKQYSL